MTAVCLKAKNSLKTHAWSSVFNDFNTDTKSCLFIKQLTTTCVSTILHLRKVFTDDYFEEKNFEGMTLKLLKSRKEDNYVTKIEQWLEGAFEALEKKYLKRLMLDIQDAETNLTLEIYTMTFNYNQDKSTLNQKNSESLTKSNTIKLLQLCHAVTQTYGALPSQVKLSMRLTYYENTPENYQPNGYMAWDSTDAEFPKTPRSIEIGVAETPYHYFKFINKSCLNENFFKDMKNELENSSRTLSIEAANDSKTVDKFTEERQIEAKKELCFNTQDENIQPVEVNVPKTDQNAKKTTDTAIKREPLQNTTTKTTTGTKTVRVLKKLSITGDLKVRCACLGTEMSDTMFPCLGCRFLVHAECYGILKFDTSKKIRFYCHLCHQTENNFKCHDKVILNLKNSSDQQKLSLLRKVLRYCTMPSVDKITLKKIEKIGGTTCPKNVSNVILNKMIEIGVAVPQGRKKTYLINKQVLENKLLHYFYKVQNSQSQVLSLTINTKESTKKSDFEKSVTQKTEPSTVTSQECLAINTQSSEQSYSIYC